MLTVFLYIAAVAAGLMFPKSKVVFVFQVACMAIIGGCCFSNADYSVYQQSYVWAQGAHADNPSRYVGYVQLANAFAFSNVNFEVFYFVVVCLGVSLTAIAIASLTDCAAFALSCYVLCAFPMEAVQIKSLLANACLLCMVALVTIAGRPNPKPYRKRLLFIAAIIAGLAGVSFQYSAVFSFGIIAVWLVIGKLPQLKPSVLVALIGAILIVEFLVIYSLSERVIIGLYGESSISNYFMGYTTGSGSRRVYLFGAITLLNIAACECAHRMRTPEEPKGNGYNLRQLIWLTVLILPLLTMANDFFRLERLFIVLAAAFLCNTAPTKTGINVVPMLIYFVVVVGTFALEPLFYYETVLGALLANNGLPAYLEAILP